MENLKLTSAIIFSTLLVLLLISCNSNDNDSEEECEKESIGAFFPELGVSIDFGGVRIYPYVRRYFDSKIHNKENRDAYGLQLGINF